MASKKTKSDPSYPELWVRVCEEADSGRHHPRHPEGEGRKVHVVDLAHDPRPGVLLGAERSLERKVQHHPDHAYRQSRHQAPKRSLETENTAEVV